MTTHNHFTSHNVLQTIKLSIIVILFSATPFIFGDSKKLETFNLKQFTLNNGFTIFVKPNTNKDYVTIRLVIHFGSADEVDGQRGAAHIIEHMLFKGTENISESDLSLFCQKYQCSLINANTNTDRTSVDFNLPVDSWKQVIPILAEIFSKASIKQEFLDSEIGAILQEERIHNTPDHILYNAIIKTLFSEHNYQHSVIGYPEDILAMTTETLRSIYKKHYIPNNAVLEIIGDIDPQEVLSLAQTYFGPLEPDWTYTRQSQPLDYSKPGQEIVVKQNVAHTHVKLIWKQHLTQDEDMPFRIFQQLFLMPGISNLYSQLVKKEQLVSAIKLQRQKYYNSSLLTIDFIPYDEQAIPTIIQKIKEGITTIATQGFDESNIKAFIENDKISLLDFLQSNSAQAGTIADAFLRFNDPQHFYRIPSDEDTTKLNQAIKAFVSKHFDARFMNIATLKPWTEQEQKDYQELLAKKDRYQTEKLSNRIRTSNVEAAQYTKNITLRKSTIKTIQFTPKSAMLSNGIEVIYVNLPEEATINVALIHKAPERYAQLTGSINGFGTLRATLEATGSISKTIEDIINQAFKLGLSYNLNNNGFMFNVKAENLNQALNLMTDYVIFNPHFDENELNTIKKSNARKLENAWKNGQAIASVLEDYLVTGKKAIPSLEVSNKLTAQECASLYKKTMLPNNAKLIIAGNLTNYPDLITMLEQIFGTWKPAEHDILESEIIEGKGQEAFDQYGTTIVHDFEQDNTNLVIYGPSLSSKQNQCLADSLALTLYAHHINKRLFTLRQKHGIFYYAGGTVNSVIGNKEHWLIETAVKPEKVNEMIDLINAFLLDDLEKFSQDDLDKALASLSESMNHTADTTDSIFSNLINFAQDNLPYDYYPQLINAYQNITLEDVKKAAKKYIHPERKNIVIVGRTDTSGQCSIKQPKATGL